MTAPKPHLQRLCWQVGMDVRVGSRVEWPLAWSHRVVGWASDGSLVTNPVQHSISVYCGRTDGMKVKIFPQIQWVGRWCLIISISSSTSSHWVSWHISYLYAHSPRPQLLTPALIINTLQLSVHTTFTSGSSAYKGPFHKIGCFRPLE